MDGKNKLNIKDFMSIGWNRVKLLMFTKSINLKNYTIRVTSKEKDSDHNVNKKTRKYNFEDIESEKINEFLYSEKTKLIINGNM